MRVIYGILFLVSSCTWANESFMQWTGGNFFPSADNAAIQMESESVALVLNENMYDVDASFVFKNTGAAMTVLMGFPVSCGGVLFDEDLLKEIEPVLAIRTWINGEEVSFTGSSRSMEYYEASKGPIEIHEPGAILAFKTRVKDLSERKSIYTIKEVYWYVKEVRFSQGERLTTRVHYRTKYGKNSDKRYFFASYIYGSGKGWRGSIKHAEFTIQTSKNVWMACYPRVPHKHRWKRIGEYSYSLAMENLEPKENDELQYTLTSQLPPYLNEAGCYDPDMEITEDLLSLCSRRDLEKFLSYEGTPRSVGKQRSASTLNGHRDAVKKMDSALFEAEKFDLVREHLKAALENNFIYEIQESGE